MKRLAWMLLLAAPPLAAQGVRYDNVVLGPRGGPVAGATVAVCTAAATRSQTPCAPLATIYADAALTTPLANPFTADALGNYGFWAPPGHYVVQIYGSNIATRTMDVILPCDPSSNCTLSNATVSSLTVGTLALTGNLTVGGRNVATEPLVSDAVQFVSANGNDNNDGLSWGSAKATIFAAYQALPAAGGTIYIAQNASCGGPNNAIWIAGPLGEPQWNNGNGNPAAGWLPRKPVRFVGWSGSGNVQNGSPTGVTLNCTTTQSPIWLSGSDASISFENIALSSNVIPVKIGISSQTGAQDTGSQNLRFINCHFTLNSGGTGPVVLIGSNSFWIWFINGGLNIIKNPVVDDSDNGAAMVLNPHGSTGSDIGLIFLRDMTIDSGFIHFYNDQTNDPHGYSSLYARDITFEGVCTSKGAFWFNTNGGFGSYLLSNIEVADTCSGGSNYSVYVDSWTGFGSNIYLSGRARNVYGPVKMSVVTQYPVEWDPYPNGQLGQIGPKFYGQVDAARRLFPPMPMRVQNQAPLTNWAYSGTAGTDYQIGVPDPTGGNDAVRFLTTSGNAQPFRNSVSISVGDILIGGVWVRPIGNTDLTGTQVFNIFNNSSGCSLKMLPSNTPPGPIYMTTPIKGSNQWQWIWQVGKFTASSGTCDIGMQVGGLWGQVDVYGPVFMIVPASAGWSDSEAIEYAINLSSAGNLAPAGTIATIPHHSFSIGGTGDTFWATFDHSLTANRTITIPDMTGPMMIRQGYDTITVNTTVNAQSCTSVSGTVTGASSSLGIVANPATDPGNVTWSAFSTAANQVTIKLCNPTTSAVTLTNVTFYVRVFGP